MKRALLMSLLVLGGSAVAGSAQSSAGPIVSIAVTLPDGEVKALTAPESGTANFTLADGTEFVVRPTILDAKPWNRVVVTVFTAPTATQAPRELGAVETKVGASPVQIKSNPPFRVAVSKVTASESAMTPSRSTQSR